MGLRLGEAMSYYTRFQNSFEQIEKISACSPVKQPTISINTNGKNSGNISRDQIIPTEIKRKQSSVSPVKTKRKRINSNILDSSNLTRQNPVKHGVLILPIPTSEINTHSENNNTGGIQEKDLLNDIFVEFNNNANGIKNIQDEDSDASFDENILGEEDLKSLVQASPPKPKQTESISTTRNEIFSKSKSRHIKHSCCGMTRSPSQGIPATRPLSKAGLKRNIARSNTINKSEENLLKHPNSERQGEFSISITNKREENKNSSTSSPTRYEAYRKFAKRVPHRTIQTESVERMQRKSQLLVPEPIEAVCNKFELLPLLQVIKQRMMIKEIIEKGNNINTIQSLQNTGLTGFRHHQALRKIKEDRSTPLEGTPEQSTVGLAIKSQRVQLFKRMGSSFYLNGKKEKVRNSASRQMLRSNLNKNDE